MKNYITTWNKEELQAYIFIYSMNADFKETESEVKIIKNTVSEDVFKMIHEEFDKDNDYDSTQKIANTVKRLKLAPHEIQYLFDEIKNIFNADGDFDVLERNLALGLKRILSS